MSPVNDSGLLLLLVLAAQGCREHKGTESDDTARALCGGNGEVCCPEPSVPCGVQLECDPDSQLCRLEAPPAGTDRLCRSGRDCAAGQTCCMAGNYGTCLPLDPAACPAPDLELFYDPAYVSPANEAPGFGTGAFPAGLSVSRKTFSEDSNGAGIDPGLPLVDPPAAAFRSCAVEKPQCLGGAGLRTLLHFSINVHNVGDADLILGPAGAPGVESAACDGANYFPKGWPQPLRSPPYRQHYLLYQLLDAAENVERHNYGLAPTVSCLPAAQSTSRFSCEFLGLEKGAFETYDESLECQWLDITGVPPGQYTLHVTVNPDHSLTERRYDNNFLDIPVHLPSPDLLAACPGSDNRLAFSVTAQRDCGWVAAPAASCTPGTSVDFGCPGCSGDPVLRICEGTSPCTSDQALASGNDVSSTDFCPVTRFVCPGGGTYNWMHGPWFGDQLDPWQCDAHVLSSAAGP
jgi:Lysyl oxidase